MRKTIRAQVQNKQVSVFKPMIATSLTLAMGISVGMAQGSGTQGNGQPYYDITTNTTSEYLSKIQASQVTGDGSVANPWVWTYSGFLAKNGETAHLNAENAIFKLGANGDGFIGGAGNSSNVSLNFKNSTLVGNISSGQNDTSAVQTVTVSNASTNNIIKAAYVFDGNNTYNGESWAMVGKIYTDVTSGGNYQVAFTNGANMKGNIYAASGQTVNVNFSNKDHADVGNTFIGRIGTPGNIDSSERQGTTNVTFLNNATLKASEDDTGTLLFVAANAWPTTDVNLTLGSASNNANTSSTLSGDIIAGTGQFYKEEDYNQHERNIITSYATSLVVGKDGVNNQVLARKTGVNTFDIKAGSVVFNSTIVAGAQGASSRDGRGRNIFKFNNASNGKFLSNIASQYSNSQNYILALGSGTIKLGDKSANKTINISATSSGGGSNAGTFVTDYDSTASGFDKTQTSGAGNVELNANRISLQNASGENGQFFILDVNTGSAVVNSGEANTDGSKNSIQRSEHSTMVIRFRGDTASSITIGDATMNNGHIYTTGSNGGTLLQAKEIQIYGDIITSSGQAYIIGSKTDGTNSLSVNSIQSSGGYLANGSTTLDFSNGGSLDTGFIIAQKNDGGGDATQSVSATFDNSEATKNGRVVISVIDPTSTVTKATETSLKLRGATLHGSNNNYHATFSATDGHYALFTNTADSKITLDLKNGTASQSYIVGDIFNQAGTINVKMTEVNTGSNPSVFVGNLENKGGSTNLVFENAIYAPTNLVNVPNFGSSPEAKRLAAYVKQYGTGTITTNGGTTTLVSRINNPILLSGTPLEFNVNANGGETNIIMQIDNAVTLNTVANINYSGAGIVNAVFAGSNDGAQGTVVGGTETKRIAQTESFDGTTQSSSNTFFGLTYKDGVKLTLKSRNVYFGNEQVNLVERYGSQYETEGRVFKVKSSRSGTTDTVELVGLGIGNITSLADGGSAAQKTYNTKIADNSAFVGSVALNGNASANLEMAANTKFIAVSDKGHKAPSSKIELGTLKLSGDQNKTINQYQLQLDTLSQTNNRVINLATDGGSATAIQVGSDFRLLEVGEKTKTTGGLQFDTSNGLTKDDQTLVLMTYINQNADQANGSLGGVKTTNGTGTYGYTYADRVVIHNVGGGTDTDIIQAGKIALQFAVDTNTDLSSITHKNGGTEIEGNIAVLTVANATGATAGTTDKALIQMDSQVKETLQGFDVISGTLTAVATDENGKTNVGTNNYTTYFVDSVKTTGADTAVQDAVATTFATSLDIFTANFNSLNKRMGELRDNNNAQGAWGRVFGGQQTSDFGLGSETTYVTVQAGYDYAFGFEGANNYLGFALAYSNSSSKTSNSTNTLNGVSEGLDGDMKSNMVEVGIYNAYVQDEGWYNDSIFKFSYIMNDFSTTGTASGNSVSTTNYGIVLSDEFGYRFKLGDAKEWYIDPQLEVAFGYVNGTEYALTSGRSELQAKSDSLMQLRARFGSSFGYDFKQFTQGKGVDAKLYVGAFYEYDYFNGGDLTLTTNLGGVNSIQSALSSDGRVVMNVGTNVTIKENTRIYFDFETSFAGKIRTDYQANVGVRYSFGENTSYVPTNGVKKEVAPLKVSDENDEASKEATQNTTNSETKSEATTEQNTNSTENKSEVKAQ